MRADSSKLRTIALSLTAVLLIASRAEAVLPGPPGPYPQPVDATVDLTTSEGAALVGAVWRFADARIVEVDHREPGPDLKASGRPNRTHDISPRAGVVGFDDSAWATVAPEELSARRGGGKLSFAWFRTRIVVPAHIADFATVGSTAVFEIHVDDYAEVSVNGSLPLVLGQRGGPLVAGFNAPNRFLLGRDLRPGASFDVAVLAANGPLGDPPANFIWVRSASVDFYAADKVSLGEPVELDVVRKKATVGEMEAIVPRGARLERIATGFEFLEGPAWSRDGYLLFSDPNANRIYRYADDGTVSVFRTKSGYAGADIGRYHQPGSNGLAFDPGGRLTVCEHGRRRVVRIERNGTVTVLADRFEGKRLNSPNDLVYRSDGTLCFSDPPFGLAKAHADPARELPFSGVFCLRDGRLELVDDSLSGPNGLAFSPDERFLYVSNWDPQHKVVMRYTRRGDGSYGDGQVFFDLTDARGEEALDGVKVDQRGDVFVSGPGGVAIVSSEGKHLGTLVAPELPANFTFGDDDGRTLYMTARSGLYRLRLAVAGARTGCKVGAVERNDPRFDAIFAPEARLRCLADGFSWVEGPAVERSSGTLYFTDIPANSVYRITPNGAPELFLKPAGYSGTQSFDGREPGANGLAFDAAGRLLLCEHGDRRLTRLETGGSRTVLAERYEGKRLNSPNDVVVAADGTLYFTDPPFGLPKSFDDPARELDFAGVYRVARDGTPTLLTRDIEAPNGIALSPDERTLYVSNASRRRPVVVAYPLDNGVLGKPRQLFDASPWMTPTAGVPDGMTTDRHGNLYLAGPGGIHLFARDGARLGRIGIDARTSNVEIDEMRHILYVTADRAVYAMPMKGE